MHKFFYTLLMSTLLLHSPVQAQSTTPELEIKKATIYWDSSLSMLDKAVEKELDFLDNYFHNIPNASVDLVVFSNSIDLQQSFSIVNSEWTDLRKVLLNTNYDGLAFFDVLLEVEPSDPTS